MPLHCYSMSLWYSASAEQITRLTEHLTSRQEVEGSNPALSTPLFDNCTTRRLYKRTMNGYRSYGKPCFPILCGCLTSPHLIVVGQCRVDNGQMERRVVLSTTYVVQVRIKRPKWAAVRPEEPDLKTGVVTSRGWPSPQESIPSRFVTHTA